MQTETFVIVMWQANNKSSLSKEYFNEDEVVEQCNKLNDIIRENGFSKSIYFEVCSTDEIPRYNYKRQQQK